MEQTSDLAALMPERGEGCAKIPVRVVPLWLRQAGVQDCRDAPPARLEYGLRLLAVPQARRRLEVAPHAGLATDTRTQAHPLCQPATGLTKMVRKLAYSVSEREHWISAAGGLLGILAVLSAMLASPHANRRTH